MKNEIAILMAAGKGTRMRPLTLYTPKPLVKVKGLPMIETVIEGLNGRGVKDIYVVVGYLGEQFEYLTEKYNNVHIVKNNEYEVINNISSIHAVRDVIKNTNSDCFICEADLFVPNPEVLNVDLDESCYFGKFISGYSNDWLFETENGYITHIGKNGNDKYNMCGISYFKNRDIKLISYGVEKQYEKGGYEDMYWDEIVDMLLGRIDLTVHPIGRYEIVEIDTVDELKTIDPSYEEGLCN